MEVIIGYIVLSFVTAGALAFYFTRTKVERGCDCAQGRFPCTCKGGE